MGIVAPLLLLTACQSKLQHAQGNEVAYDRLMAAEDYRGARKAILKSIEYQPDVPSYWFKLGQVEAALANYNGAFSAYQHVADLQPDNIEALENLSVLAIRGGDRDVAKRYSEQLILLQPDSIPGQLVQGALAVADRRVGDAQRIADKMIAADPNREEAYLLKARALDAMGHTPEAAAVIQHRVDLNPGNPDLLQQLLQYRRAMGQRSEIQSIAVRLAQIYPDNVQYVIESARAFHAQGRDDVARSALEELKQRFSTDPRAIRAIAGFWHDMAPANVARQQIATLAQGSTPAVTVAVADMLITTGDAKTALTLTGPLMKDATTSASVPLETVHSRALIDAGRLAEASALLDRLVAFDDTNTAALALRAQVRLGQNRLADALSDAQLAANGDPSSEEAQRLVAQIYAQQGNKLLAEQVYGGLQRHFPDSITALQSNIDWLLSQGKKERAIAISRSFARGHPNMSAARQAYAATCKSVGAEVCNADGALRLSKHW